VRISRFFGGANWNRTSDLSIVREVLQISRHPGGCPPVSLRRGQVPKGGHSGLSGTAWEAIVGDEVGTESAPWPLGLFEIFGRVIGNGPTSGRLAAQRIWVSLLTSTTMMPWHDLIRFVDSVGDLKYVCDQVYLLDTPMNGMASSTRPAFKRCRQMSR
jgi:hypothetical protein